MPQISAKSAGTRERPDQDCSILVVDDAPSNLLAIEAALGDLAAHVVRAQSGTEALRLLLDRDFALILLDVQMPSLGGFETARLIRERPRSRHTPIIFITGYDRDHEQVLAAYSMGAVDFLFKPIVPEVLSSKARVFVELRRQAAEVVWQAKLLREHEQRETERQIEQERRRWQAEALRRQRDDAQRAARDLERKTDELSDMVRAKEQVERELVRINRELGEADRRKDEFLALLGHELRNPLAPIMTGLEVLRAKLQDAAAADPGITRVHGALERQARHLARLVDDLLDISRINSGKLEMRRESTTINEVIEHALAASQPFIDEHHHVLSVELPPEPVRLQADPVRLTQVLANLLNNAARYTPDRGKIAVRAVGTGDEVVVTVTDSGRGIDPELLPRIFDPFVQAQRGGGGLGLGLTLVRRVIELHGGTVSVSNSPSTGGAEFVVKLPLFAGESRATDDVASPGAARVRRRVVIVDDNPDIRETLSELLSLWQHDITTAADGMAGVELICATLPDVAIVDIGLPKLDGYAVAARVRERLGPDRVRLVAMSGYGQRADRVRALQAGFDAHLVKPVDINRLANLLSAETPTPASPPTE